MPPSSGGRVGPHSSIIPVYQDPNTRLLSGVFHDEESDPPHYIDDSSSAEDDSDLSPDTTSPTPSLLIAITPPPPLKSVAFDWSNLNFGDLQFSSPTKCESNNNDEVNEDNDQRYNVEILPDETYSDNIKNSLCTKGTNCKNKDPKTILKTCKRKFIKSGKALKDRSRSVDIGYGIKPAFLFRNRSSDHHCNSRLNNNSDDLSQQNCNLWSNRTSKNGDDVTDKNCNSQCNKSGTQCRPQRNVRNKAHTSDSIHHNTLNTSHGNICRSHGRTGSIASLPSGGSLRSRLRDTIWVTGVRRRESIGLITQPVLSAIRGAGRRVKYRTRSVSKVSVNYYL